MVKDGRRPASDTTEGVVGIWTWDIQRNLVFLDPSTADYFGLDAAEARSGVDIGRCIDAIHPDDRDRVAEKIRECLASGEPFRHGYRVFTLSHGLRSILAIGRPYWDKKGTLRHFPGYIVDLSEPVASLDLAIAYVEHARETLGLGDGMLNYLFEALILQLRQHESR